MRCLGHVPLLNPRHRLLTYPIDDQGQGDDQAETVEE